MIRPKVSVGLPVYNGERYLVNALKGLIEQSFEDFELIVCDNASTDSTEEICRTFEAKDSRIRYFRNETNIGLGANHNRTFELSRGECFKWAAHDDDFPRVMLSRFVEVMEESGPSVSVVYSRCEYIDEFGNLVGIDSDGVASSDPRPYKRLAHLLRYIHMYNSPFGLIRSSILRKTRLHGLYPMADHVLMAELVMLGAFVEIPEPLLRIRRHPGRTFTANKDPKALRELFTPGRGHRFSLFSLRTRMEMELIRSTVLAPMRFPDKTACTAVSAVTPQWRSFKAFGGRQKRRLFERFSSVHPALRVGDWVEVRTKDEIFATLDRNGQRDGMPFMPEMFDACGKRFRVYKRAHKTCDTAYEFKGRKVKDAVHLEGVRCSGQSHGGCEASCLIFWKTAWLRPVSVDSEKSSKNTRGASRDEVACCNETDILRATYRQTAEDSERTYVCQATQVPTASEPLSQWDWSQYIEDYTSGNVTLGRIVKSFVLVVYRRCLVNLGIGIGPPLKWLYDGLQSLRRGVPYPFKDGKIALGVRTPTAKLDLQPGELVRVKSYSEIVATCDQSRMNRGMTFDPEMVPYCGGTYKVLGRVTKIVNEQTGKMQQLKNPCIQLDSVVCQARYCDNRLFCPRSVYPYWREIWLERVGPVPSSVHDARAAIAEGTVSYSGQQPENVVHVRSLNSERA